MSSNEWTKYKLGTICKKIGSGATPTGGKESYSNSGKYALIRSQNVLDFTFSYDGLAFINESQATKLNNVTIEEGDVLLNITGDSVARACQVPSEILPARVNQHVSIIRPQNDILSTTFLKYYLLNPIFKSHLLNLSAVGATRNAITKSMIEDLDVVIPSIETQRRISFILSSLDDKIKNNLQTNQTLEEISRTIFKEWFVNFNYPNANGSRKHSELGEIPTDWVIGALGDIYKTTSGGTPSRSKPEYYENGTIGWIKSKELNNTFILDTEEKITEAALKNSSAKLLPANSVLIAIAGATIGEIGINTKEVTCNQNVCAFLNNSEYPYTFIYHFLLANKLDIIGRAIGSAQQYISQSALNQYKLIIPPNELVEEFHKIVEPLFEKIKDNIEENETLKELRDSLLPKLMNGQIPINISNA